MIDKDTANTKFQSLMGINISGLSVQEALDSVAQLIDLSGDFERTDGTDKAFQWLNEIEKHDLMSHQQALLDYYRSNAWSNPLYGKEGFC